MRCLITGITSFHASHIADRLVQKGYEVHGLTRHVSNRDLDIKGVDVHLGDIRDYADIEKIIIDINPEIIIHLAAQTPVEYSFTHESEVMQVNFIGTVNVAKIAKELPYLEKFIFANSVEVYGNQNIFPITENNPINPASPYAVAKSASEIYLNYLHRGYNFPSIILRTTNTYGRSKTHYFVIEHIIYEMLNGAKKIPMGVPESIRDFLYVEDEVDAYLKFITYDSPLVLGETFNTGTGVGITIKDLFYKIRDKIGADCEPVWYSNSPRPYEIKSLIIDSSKLTAYTGWKPKYDLDKGLDKTIDLWRK